MKVFFDTNVYIAEALLGKTAQRLIAITHKARWRIYANQYLLDEVALVLVDRLGFSSRVAHFTQRKIIKRCILVRQRSHVQVIDDPKDSPILQGAISAGAGYLVSNDRHLLAMHPFGALRIISMDAYYGLLKEQGLLR